MTKCVFGCDEPAVARVHDDVVDVAVCERHKLEIQTDMYPDVNTVELNPEPVSAYETLEQFPDEGSSVLTASGVNLAERYGTPWPVSGDARLLKGMYRYSVAENLSSVARGSGFDVPLYYSNLFSLRQGKKFYLVSGKNWVCGNQ